MMTDHSAESKYNRRIAKYGTLLKKLKRELSLSANLRLLLFFGGAGVLILLYVLRLHIVFAACAVAIVVFFILLVIRHNRLSRLKDLTSALFEINKQSLSRLKHEWNSFNDTGRDFIDPNHDYALDLDIFGEGSLFQMINCAVTFKGRQRLKSLLTAPQKTLDAIRNRQQAVHELSEKLRWRQHFHGEAMLAKNEGNDPLPLFRWAVDSGELASLIKAANYLRWLPIVTLPLFALYLTTPLLSWYLPIGLILVQFILLSINSGKLGLAFGMANRFKDTIHTYSRLIQLFEKENFRSHHLNELKSRLKDQKGLSASDQIRKLMRITDAIDNRGNFFFFIIDVLMLWDFHFLIRLENWKKVSGASLESWFEVIGEMEALCSLAVLRHDHPDWAVPEISDEGLYYDAKALGHPLLPETRIANDLRLTRDGNVMLITGSNMSGKSTFLRTAGINLVLAYAGAPVCARSMKCTLMNIHTCMRITDNLEQNISSFYAELLRIKEIVKASQTGEPLFFLLDEIFKGTNSMDRHAGAEAVIHKLSQSKALGMVSTHDLELGAIERTNPHVRNYHFREFYKDSKIYFDYRLRNGVSTTRNASYLMRMAGIEI